MHELAICQALIGQVEAVARDHGGQPQRVWIRIGPLSGAEPALLRRAYPLAAAGSIAGAATLEIETTPIRVYCRRCDVESEASANRLLCVHCGDWRTRLVGGDELLLARVELSAPPA